MNAIRANFLFTLNIYTKLFTCENEKRWDEIVKKGANLKKIGIVVMGSWQNVATGSRHFCPQKGQISVSYGNVILVMYMVYMFYACTNTSTYLPNLW